MRFLLTRALPIAVLAWAVGVSMIFVLDHGEHPVPADAVVVLVGSKTRLPVGVRLGQQGFASLLVVSRGGRTKLERRVCTGREASLHTHVLCFTAVPSSTRGEAEFIGRLAKRRGLSR